MGANGFLEGEFEGYGTNAGRISSAQLGQMIENDQLIGDLLKIDYSEAVVLVHDHHRQKVGGVPLGCFLLATRLPSAAKPDPSEEESALILLRVLGPALLPNASETDIYRFAAGQRASDTPETWDAPGKTDQFTLHALRYAGVRCRVLGTFHMRNTRPSEWVLAFGSDIPNFYSGRGMKVYKPVKSALSVIVNFTRTLGEDAHPLAGQRIPVARVRYAATERSDDSESSVQVNIDPTDLIARRTALFGMSRTGKSNTTKIIASSVFRLRARDAVVGRVGQLIFDVNGEYANQNAQDHGCLKSVWEGTGNSSKDDVVTYGQTPHPNDPGRRIIKLNFFGDEPQDWTDRDIVSQSLEPLVVGKQIIDTYIAKENYKYISAFRDTSVEPPLDFNSSAVVRYKRAIFVYRTILSAANFSPPNVLQRPSLLALNRNSNIFNKDLVEAMLNSNAPDENYRAQYNRAGQILGKNTCSWDQAIEALSALRHFISDSSKSGYAHFNQKYGKDHEGRSWHDDRLMGLLALLEYQNGVRILRGLTEQHDSNTAGDFAESIVNDLVSGRLVIVDQSVGDPEMNRHAAERIMWALFERQKASFVHPRVVKGKVVPPPDVIVYVEEAHNLLPSGSTADLRSIWSRAAKEGSKYKIGLLYATQEPSSIQSNILKNTDNWFVAHLNNADEVRELKKYYDFEDFVQQILNVPEPGFLRMRTLSNPYIVPVQVNRFIAKMETEGKDVV